MESIMAALLGALAVLGNATASAAAKEVVGAAWSRLKNALTRKHPDSGQATQLLDDLRATAPQEAPPQAVLERFAKLPIFSEPEVASAVQQLAQTINNLHVESRSVTNIGTLYGAVNNPGTIEIKVGKIDS